MLFTDLFINDFKAPSKTHGAIPTFGPTQMEKRI